MSKGDGERAKLFEAECAALFERRDEKHWRRHERRSALAKARSAGGAMEQKSLTGAVRRQLSIANAAFP